MLQKSYDCLTCHKQIGIAKIDNVTPGQKKKWEKYELDVVTFHVCRKQQPEQSATPVEDPRQQPVVSNELYKEIAAIKAQLLLLLTKVEHFEKELLQK